MGWTPSKYQQAIFGWISEGQGNAVVEAVAGSGKTTTMVEALALMGGRVLFCAFNKHIATELSAKLAKRGVRNVVVSTIHSLGFSAVRRAFGRVNVEDDKMRRILRALLSPAEWENPTLVAATLKLADLCRMTLTDAANAAAVEELVERYDVETNGDLPRVLEALPRLIDAGRSERTTIDFADMIYLPLALSLAVDRYDWVCVDEAQDLNAAQRELVLKAAQGGRVMAVGDRRQSIYGFAGADTESIPRLVAALSATVLPLSICYRCPSSHLDLARQIVPQIEARPDAPKGEVWNEKLEKAQREMRDGDLVVCRINAPLAKVALDLIKRGQKAVIRGRDIAGSLLTLLEKHGGRSGDLAKALAKLSEYAERECAKFEKANRSAKAESLRDKVEVIWALADGCQTLAEVKRRIETIFSDEKVGVVLSSVHRAKGLEAERVFVYKPELMPFPKASKAWEVEQEMNLKYVSLTRAKEQLWLVSE